MIGADLLTLTRAGVLTGDLTYASDSEGASSIENCYLADQWLMKTYTAGHALSTMPDVQTLTLVGQSYVPTIDFYGEDKFQLAIPGTPGDYFATTFQGRFVVQTAGIYTFCTNSDDGSDLTIDGLLIVDNGGLHGTQRRFVLHSGLACALTP